jgi:hypothetical protein
MLVDIFARRYECVQIRDRFEQRDSRLLVQTFRILAEDVYPYYNKSGYEEADHVLVWNNIHNRLSRELGVQELSRQWFSYTTKLYGNDHLQTHRHPMVKVCENWMMQAVIGHPDQFIKERLSLIEIGFRERECEISAMNATPIIATERPLASPSRSSMRVPPIPEETVKSLRAERTEKFRASVEELNARFRQARYPLNYHNGYIQISTDDLIQRAVETPFWAFVASPNWKNVDLDMKEALDRLTCSPWVIHLDGESVPHLPLSGR